MSNSYSATIMAAAQHAKEANRKAGWFTFDDKWKEFSAGQMEVSLLTRYLISGQVSNSGRAKAS